LANSQKKNAVAVAVAPRILPSTVRRAIDTLWEDETLVQGTAPSHIAPHEGVQSNLTSAVVIRYF
jgi:hypothetical protein